VLNRMSAVMFSAGVMPSRAAASAVESGGNRRPRPAGSARLTDVLRAG
jgi:hypothetical protein